MPKEITGAEKRRVLVVGSGGVGTMVSVALERSSMASVTAVLRSNYQKVIQDGFDIQSIDHGELTNWRPSAGMKHHFWRKTRLIKDG